MKKQAHHLTVLERSKLSKIIRDAVIQSGEASDELSSMINVPLERLRDSCDATDIETVPDWIITIICHYFRINLTDLFEPVPDPVEKKPKKSNTKKTKPDNDKSISDIAKIISKKMNISYKLCPGFDLMQEVTINDNSKKHKFILIDKQSFPNIDEIELGSLENLEELNRSLTLIIKNIE